MRRRSPASELSVLERAGNAVQQALRKESSQRILDGVSVGDVRPMSETSGSNNIFVIQIVTHLQSMC